MLQLKCSDSSGRKHHELQTTMKMGEGDGEMRRVLIFGRTFSGKSTLANMLVTGGLTEPVFKVGDSMVAITRRCETKRGLGYEVTDTVGLGEETESERKDAKDLIVEFLKKTNGSYHHILFAREASRMDILDTTVWKLFLEIFQEDTNEFQNQQQDIHRGMVVVLTKCRNPDKWLMENKTDLENRYKEVKGRFIAVDFPPIDDDEEQELLNSKKRENHLRSFRNSLDAYYGQNRECSVFKPRYYGMNEAQLGDFADKLLTLLRKLAAATKIADEILLNVLFAVRVMDDILKSLPH